MKHMRPSKPTNIGCHGKVKFKTYSEAKKAMKHQKRVDRNSRGAADTLYGPVDIYRCIVQADHWHIGKAGPKRTKLQPYSRRRSHDFR